MVRTKKKVTISIFVIVVMATIFASVRLFGQPIRNQSRHRIELFLPGVAGERNFVEFSIPSGKYVIKAEIQGELLYNDSPRLIHYMLILRRQGITIDQDARVDFSNGAKEVWLKSFEVKGGADEGVLVVEMVDPGPSTAKAKIIILRRVLFVTVE